MTDYWHWTAGMKLRDGTPVVAGEWTEKIEDIKLCHRGYHASERAIDALRYAPGATIHRVELAGGIIRGDDKLVAQTRRVLWTADATDILREFARWCALQVIDLWDAPQVVIEYLETGKEELRDAAKTAAWGVWAGAVDEWAAEAARAAASLSARDTADAAARAAADAAARAAAEAAARAAAEAAAEAARDAAEAAAEAATRDRTRTAAEAAARAAAEAAAEAARDAAEAARDAQNTKLEELLKEERK